MYKSNIHLVYENERILHASNNTYKALIFLLIVACLSLLSLHKNTVEEKTKHKKKHIRIPSCLKSKKR